MKLSSVYQKGIWVCAYNTGHGNIEIVESYGMFRSEEDCSWFLQEINKEYYNNIRPVRLTLLDEPTVTATPTEAAANLYKLFQKMDIAKFIYSVAPTHPNLPDAEIIVKLFDPECNLANIPEIINGYYIRVQYNGVDV